MLIHPWDKCGEVSRVPRSQIKAAEYNPRRPLTADQKRRLTKGLEKHGLTECLVWNKRSGVLVGGHQRLAILDTTAPEGDWLVPVIVRELDEAQERELNILLNNQESQATYDFAKLGELFRDTAIKIDIESTGFDPAKLKSIIPNIAVTIPEVNAVLTANSEAWRAQRKASVERQDAAYDRMAAKAEQPQAPIAMPTEQLPVDRYEAGIQNIDDLFYFVVVFQDLFYAMKAKQLMSLPADEREVDGRVVMQILQEWAVLKAKNIQVSA